MEERNKKYDVLFEAIAENYNISHSERAVLDEHLTDLGFYGAVQGDKHLIGVGAFVDELKDAAFEEYYDGEKDEEDWKEATWQQSRETYINYCLSRASNKTLFSYAVDMGGVEVVEELIPYVDVNKKEDGLGLTPLHYAALRNSAPVVLALLKHGAKTDAVDSQGQTPVMMARSFGKEKNALAIEKFIIEKQKKSLQATLPAAQPQPIKKRAKAYI